MNSEFIVETCTKTGLPVCQRAYLINLALGYEEEFYLPSVLAEEHEQELDEFFLQVKSYLFSRDCFKKSWCQTDNPELCPLKKTCAFELCFNLKEV